MKSDGALRSESESIELSDGAILWTITSGSGGPVILVNGGPGMADYLAPVASLLDSDYQVYRYEQRGCGRSTGSNTLTLERFVTDLEELREHWQIDRWFVVGHSWGVDLALAYALSHPERLHGLIGLSGGRIHNDRVWKQIYDQRKHTEALPPAAAPPNRDVNQALNEDWNAFCRAPDLLRRLKNLPVAVSFIYGQLDVRPSWPTEQLSQLLPAAEFFFLERADHNLWQRNPDTLQTQMRQFLTTCQSTQNRLTAPASD